MKRLSITQLIPGMIVAEDVYNLDHELLIPKGTVLTDKLITKLDLYGILTIFAEDVLPASDLSETESSYYERNFICLKKILRMKSNFSGKI